MSSGSKPRSNHRKGTTTQRNATPNPASDFQWKIKQETGSVAIAKLRKKGAPEVVVPAEIDGRPVAKIGARAFSDRRSLTEVVLPPNLKEIGSSAFRGCSALSTIRVAPENKQILVVGLLLTRGGATLTFCPQTKIGAYAAIFTFFSRRLLKKKTIIYNTLRVAFRRFRFFTDVAKPFGIDATSSTPV